MKVLKIHIGLPKCGSSTLQRAFSQTREALYLGKHAGNYINGDLLRFCREIAPAGDIRLLNHQFYRRVFAEEFALSEYNIAIISDEVLSSIGFATRGHGNSVPQIIENFRLITDCPIEIGIVVREQMAFLRSYHKHLAREKGLSLNEFLACVLLCKSRWVYPMLDISRVIKEIELLVDSVHLVPFEALFFDNHVLADFFSWAGSGDLTALLKNIHENKTEDDVSISQSINASRNLGGNCVLADFDMVNNFEWRNLLKDNSNDAKLIRRTLLRLIENNRDYRNAHKEAKSMRPLLPGNDFMDLDPVIEHELLGYVKRCNRDLAAEHPEFNWRALGYAM